MLSLSKYLRAGKILTFCLLLFFNILFSQNLIKNPSFEGYSLPIDCNGGGFEIAGFPTFHHVVNDWYGLNSPDYFHSTCNPSWYNIPNAYFGNSYANSGNAFVGIGTFDIRFDYQEYVYQLLTTPLKADSVYCLDFFVSRADRFPFAVKQIGAYFSNALPTVSGGYINANPQVVNPTGFLSDTVNWVEIQGCFTAQGGEQYLTIGNFNTNANIDTLRIQSTDPLTGTGTDVAYYYIDSVSLWKNNLPTRVNYLEQESNIRVYPNPAKDVINFMFANAVEKRRIELYDVMGNMVLSNQIESNNLVLQTDNISNGIYSYRILVNEKIIKTDKIVIIK